MNTSICLVIANHIDSFDPPLAQNRLLYDRRGKGSGAPMYFTG
jgi:hypothetical protein